MTTDNQQDIIEPTPIIEPQAPALVRTLGLTKNFGSSCALDNVNLELVKGQIIGLLGPNGSGKTTFIKILNGLLTPSSGEVYIGGKQPSVHTKKIISYLPDRTYLDTKKTGEQMIDFLSSFYSDFDSERAYKMLISLNIDPFIPLKNFSKGTKEKVQLIFVMSRNADLYILDEPIAGVDPATRDYIINTILNNYNPESSIIISTHLIADVESILDHVIFLNQGRIVLDAPVKDICRESGESVNDLFKEVFRC